LKKRVLSFLRAKDGNTKKKALGKKAHLKSFFKLHGKNIRITEEVPIQEK